jgi:hypothetical protein
VRTMAVFQFLGFLATVCALNSEPLTNPLPDPTVASAGHAVHIRKHAKQASQRKRARLAQHVTFAEGMSEQQKRRAARQQHASGETETDR